MARSGYETDERILAAIEAITGGSLKNDTDGHPENSDDPAVELWRDGGRENEIRAWLDKNCAGWRDDAPLFWGAGTFE